MQITARYPIHFTAEPPTTDRVKDAILSFPHVADVPEISKAETGTVLTVASGLGDMTVLDYRGLLYRRIGKAADAAALSALAMPFEPSRDRNEPVEPLGVGALFRPVGLAMWNRITHRLFLKGGRKAEYYAWPPGPFSPSHNQRWTRNHLEFEKYSSKTGPIDGAMFEAGRQEHYAEASKLLVVDEDLYVRTPPLAYAVGSRVSGDFVGVDIKAVFLPEWLDQNLERQYFPLDMKEHAVDYANLLHEKLSGYKSGVAFTYGRELDEVLPDAPEFGFDHRSYSINRNIMLLASDVTKVLGEKPELAQLLETSSAAALDEATDAALDLGAEIDGWKDVAEFAEDVVSAWRETGRRPGWTKIPSVRSKLGELICERTLEMVADMPISLRLDHRREMTP